MQMKSDKITTISLEKDKQPVLYKGPKVVGQFEIKSITASTSLESRVTAFNLTIAMNRVYTDQLITAFFPSCLLWFLAYFTLFITVDDFNDRIMVAVTALLVFAALLSSIKGSLPDTSYFKYIDLWFLWYTTTIFMITAFHIFLDTVDKTNKVTPSSTSGTHELTGENVADKINPSKRVQINNMAKKIVPIMTFLFNVTYILLQIIQN